MNLAPRRLRRAANQDAAEAAITDLIRLELQERTHLDSEFGRTVGGLKAVHRKVSLADCCALALAKRLRAKLVSADRHEFEALLAAGICHIEFIR
jgi:predicted nucleic acid-binding protein